MNIIKIAFTLIAFTTQLVYASQGLFSLQTQNQINSEISSKGSSRVIVGITGGAKANANVIASASMQASKTDFLTSPSVLYAKIDHSITIVDELEHLPFVVMDVKSTGLKMLMSHSQVSSIEADRKLKALLKTTVPDIVGVGNPWRQSTYNGLGSWVAVLDSGVNTAHPMFTGKSIIQACFTTDRSCPNGANTQYGGNAADPMGKSDHGTHVAGIAVGNYIASKGFGGVAYKAGLIAIQVFDQDDLAYTSSLVRALNYVYSQSLIRRVAAANLSLGSGEYLDYESCEGLSQSITSAFRKLRNRKVAAVVAAGNGGAFEALSFPACIADAIAVASSRKDYKLSTFSNLGIRVSLIAPGSNIESASYGSNYKVYSGTSMAAPMIAGSFAIMRKFDPTATVSAIEAAMQNASRPVYFNWYALTGFYNWPILSKARTNIGGTTQNTTAVGFNTQDSINRFNSMSAIPWEVDTAIQPGARGVAYTDGIDTITEVASLVYPQTIFNGRIAAKMKNVANNKYGLMIRVGGAIDSDENDLHDGYLLRISGSAYAVIKYEHGQSETIINSQIPPAPIVNVRDWNILMATTGGKTVKFYINGQFIGQHASNRLVYGAPGVFTIGKSRTYVDWFVTKSNTVNSGYR